MYKCTHCTKTSNDQKVMDAHIDYHAENYGLIGPHYSYRVVTM